MVDKKIDTAGLKNLAKLLDKQELEIDIKGNTLNGCELKYLNELTGINC